MWLYSNACVPLVHYASLVLGARLTRTEWTVLRRQVGSRTMAGLRQPLLVACADGVA